MELALTFFIAFFFSFIGTIPPGTLNLTVIQLGLEQRLRTAWRFSLGAAIVEYLYGWLAVKFDTLIISSTAVEEKFQLATGIVMLVLGVGSLWSARKIPSQLIQRFNESGFRRGIVLGLLNPLALPFWIAMTAYIRSQKWIDLSSELEVHVYLFGVSLGGLTLLMTLGYLSNKIIVYFQQSAFLKKIPGYTLIVLGIYAIMQYLL